MMSTHSTASGGDHAQLFWMSGEVAGMGGTIVDLWWRKQRVGPNGVSRHEGQLGELILESAPRSAASYQWVCTTGRRENLYDQLVSPGDAGPGLRVPAGARRDPAGRAVADSGNLITFGCRPASPHLGLIPSVKIGVSDPGTVDQWNLDAG
jgi:hypothetical protein